MWRAGQTMTIDQDLNLRSADIRGRLSFASGVGCRIGSGRPLVSIHSQSRSVAEVLRAHSLECSNVIAFADRDVRSTAKVLSRPASVELLHREVPRLFPASRVCV